MSKRIIAGALSVATAVSAFAFLAVPAFAAANAESWHQVTVDPTAEFVLGGNVSSNTTLTPSISANDSAAAGGMSVKASEPWKLQWQAVTGEFGDKEDAAAPGTFLGTDGFAASGGYTYVSTGYVAGTHLGTNSWGTSMAIAGTGGALAGTPALTVALSNVATGTATSDTMVTPTYWATTAGDLGILEHYGTIYYVLSSNS